MGLTTYAEILEALRKALSDEKGGAVATVVSAIPDGGRSWLQAADAKLRRMLVQGQLSEAESLGAIIGATREVRGADEKAFQHYDPSIYRNCLSLLIQGVRAVIASQPIPTGIQELLEVSTNILCEESLRWAAWTWMTVASSTTGDLNAAKTASDTSLTIAGQLDIHARAVSQCARAGIGFIRAEVETAKKRLLAAIALFDQIGDQREMSTAWLALGHLLFFARRERDALQAVNQAVEVDPNWAPPAIFLSRRAMISGRLEEAENVLRQLHESSKKLPEIEREMRLVQSVSGGSVPLSVATEYLWMRERPLTEALVGQLLSFSEEHRNYFALREILAWDLATTGYYSEAGRIFRSLAEELDLDPSVLLSIRKGLEYLAKPENRPVTPLKLIQERGDFEALQIAEPTLDARADPDIFWVRRAVMAGRLEEAEKLLNILSETTTRPTELTREKGLIEAIKLGTIPLAIVTEYFWIQERPMTEVVVSQIESFAEEHRSYLTLREVIAWDLALGGFSTAATRQFRALSEEMDLDASMHTSIRQGLEYLNQEIGKIRDYDSPDTTTVSGSDFLAKYVCSKQPWPTVLDQHSLLFTGKSNDIPEEVISWAEAITLREGQHAHRQGHPGWLLTFLDKGEAKASRMRGTFQDFGTVQAGAFFGEVGTIWGLPNTTDITATIPSSMKVLSRELLLRHVKAGNSEAAALLKTLRSWYLEVVFSISPIFAYIDGEFRAQLTKNSKSEIFHQGERMAIQSKPSALFMIISGLARVTISQDKRLISLGFLCPGDLVGEIDPSPVTVSAESTVTAISVDRSQIERLPSRAREKIEQRLVACSQAANASLGEEIR